MYKFFRAHFSYLKDIRRPGSIKHDFFDILFVAVVTMLSGGENFEDMHNFCKLEENWFKKFIKLKNGIPSSDTFARVLNKISPKNFSACFTRLFSDIKKYSGIEVLEREHIAIDGKRSRGSIHIDDNNKLTITHMINALSVDYGLSIAQVKVPKDKFSNEVSSILDILELIDIKGNIVTLDGIANSKIAKEIVEKKGDYIMVVKKNNPKLFNLIKKDFRNSRGIIEPFKEKVKYKENIERRVFVFDISKGSKKILWQGTKKFICYQHFDSNINMITSEKFFVSSIDIDEEEAYKYVRAHWQVENKLHWCLDVNFKEDRNKTKKGNKPAILAGLRQIALNIVKMNPEKASMRSRIKKAGWNKKYREKLVSSTVLGWKINQEKYLIQIIDYLQEEKRIK